MPWINHGYGRPCGLWKFFFHLPNPTKICQSAFCATLIYQGWSRKSNRDASQHLRGNIERAMARHSAPCTRHHLGISYEIAGPFYVDIYIYRILHSVMSYHMCCKAQFQFHINFISIQSFNNAWRKPGCFRSIEMLMYLNPEATHRQALHGFAWWNLCVCRDGW